MDEAQSLPFVVRELAEPSLAIPLFRRAFGTPPPFTPRHFVVTTAGEAPCGYVHFHELEPGVHLCGGLCLDARVYRTLDAPTRANIARRGSLSRWLLNESIASLGAKRAVFAYTGDTRSVRDVLALHFERTAHPRLFVQWHSQSVAERNALVTRVAAIGPF
jgi:hypothetical protein